MKKFKAYYQENIFAEKFYIENDDGYHLIIEAETADAAEEHFVENIFENSLYADDETAEYLKNNPIYIEEV